MQAALARKRVLVVDDNERIRTGMHAVLSRHGLVVDVAADAGEAYAIAFQEGARPDALITDYDLNSADGKAENGLDLALRLRASGLCTLPVVIVTAHHAVGLLPQVRQGDFTILYKPVKVEKLLRVLIDVLRV